MQSSSVVITQGRVELNKLGEIQGRVRVVRTAAFAYLRLVHKMDVEQAIQLSSLQCACKNIGGECAAATTEDTATPSLPTTTTTTTTIVFYGFEEIATCWASRTASEIILLSKSGCCTLVLTSFADSQELFPDFNVVVYENHNGSGSYNNNDNSQNQVEIPCVCTAPRDAFARLGCDNNNGHNSGAWYASECFAQLEQLATERLTITEQETSSSTSARTFMTLARSNNIDNVQIESQRVMKLLSLTGYLLHLLLDARDLNRPAAPRNAVEALVEFAIRQSFSLDEVVLMREAAVNAGAEVLNGKILLDDLVAMFPQIVQLWLLPEAATTAEVGDVGNFSGVIHIPTAWREVLAAKWIAEYCPSSMTLRNLNMGGAAFSWIGHRISGISLSSRYLCSPHWQQVIAGAAALRGADWVRTMLHGGDQPQPLRAAELSDTGVSAHDGGNILVQCYLIALSASTNHDSTHTVNALTIIFSKGVTNLTFGLLAGRRPDVAQKSAVRLAALTASEEVKVELQAIIQRAHENGGWHKLSPFSKGFAAEKLDLMSSVAESAVASSSSLSSLEILERCPEPVAEAGAGGGSAVGVGLAFLETWQNLVQVAFTKQDESVDKDNSEVILMVVALTRAVRCATPAEQVKVLQSLPAFNTSTQRRDLMTALCCGLSWRWWRLVSLPTPEQSATDAEAQKAFAARIAASKAAMETAMEDATKAADAEEARLAAEGGAAK